MPTDHTETQPDPNLSTEHQREGDARRPSDTLDRGQTTDRTETQPNPNLSTEPGGEHGKTPVLDRPDVGTVEPEDYPQAQQGGATPA